MVTWLSLSSQDGLEDLDLIGRGDGGVVRRIAGGVRVIEIACDGAVVVEFAGLEDDVAGGISDGDMEPGAARWECGGKFVSGEVLDGDGEGKFAVRGRKRTE